MNNNIDALRKAELFSSLPEESLQKLASRATVRRLARGNVLYSEHEEAWAVFVVAEGELRSVRQNPDGREQVLTTLRPGSLLGLVPAFDNRNRYFSTVIADSASVIICINNEDFRQVCHERPDFLWRVAQELASEICRCADLIESLSLRTVEQRVALYLLTVAEHRAVKSAEGLVFELMLTRSEIANRVGSVREVVSRSLARLAERGLIALSGERLVTIRDVDALRRFAGDPIDKELHILQSA